MGFRLIRRYRARDPRNPDLQRVPLLAELRFFLLMTVAIATIVLVGFARILFLTPLFPGVAASETFFYVHGTFSAA